MIARAARVASVLFVSVAQVSLAQSTPTPLPNGVEEELFEESSYAPLVGWETQEHLYEGAFQGSFGMGPLSAVSVRAKVAAAKDPFRWRDPNRETRRADGAVSLRGDLIRVRGESYPLVVASPFGRFQTSVRGAPSATVRAEPLGVASLGIDGLDLTGQAAAGVFAQASVEVPTEVDLAGVKARLTTQLSGYEGAGAKALFRIRADPASGKFSVEINSGLASGAGAGVGLPSEADASGLLRWLGVAPKDSLTHPSSGADGVTGGVERIPW